MFMNTPKDTRNDEKKSTRDELIFPNTLSSYTPSIDYTNNNIDIFDRNMFNNSARNNNQTLFSNEKRNIENERLMQNDIFNNKIKDNNKYPFIKKEINSNIMNSSLTRNKRGEKTIIPNRNEVFSFNEDKYKNDLNIKSDFMGILPEDTRKERFSVNANNTRQNRSVGTPSNNIK